jgi:hypothetical protein
MARRTPAQRWDAVRDYALQLPNAVEDFPWGESVVKVEKRDAAPPAWRKHLVHGPMFLWLGGRDVDVPAVAVKLRGPAHEHAVASGAASTTHSGLGAWGWLTVSLANTDVELVCDWVDASYRVVAPKKLVKLLDSRPPG